jgi:CO/xanthine dehydrogenase FAD-binding subunit
MKPPKFEYAAPENLEEVMTLLGQYGDDAKILAGGQSLVPMMNMRLARPGYIVDVNRVRGLSYIREEDGILAMGALTRHKEVEKSELVRKRNPLIAEAATFIGHPQVRNRGTVGGTLAHADPAAEMPAVIVALDGELVIRGASGTRTCKPEDFFLTFLTVQIDPSEMLVEARFPVVTGRTGTAFLEFSRRHGDFAIVAVAAALTLDGKGVCKKVGLGLAGVGPTPIRPAGAEKILTGQTLKDDVIEQAAIKAAEETDPASDVHGSADYRREMVKVFTRRALKKALERVPA